jgi:dihydropteroate synthase
MGILNVTPDSFSDGGKYFRPEEALARAKEMVAAGADIIDIGGESTRPFSEAISAEEEARRVLPVIEALAPQVTIPISIDTTKRGVAELAIKAGASIINDIGALRMDPGIADVAAQYDVPLILMHMQGTPGNMQMNPHYDDLEEEITAFLEKAVETAQKHGISRSRIIVDPGIGFGKTFDHNLQIISHLDFLGRLDLPVLIGTSRKAFIRSILKSGSLTEPSPSDPLVETGTQATLAVAIMKGAHIVRVHDVANTLATVRLTDALKQVMNGNETV